MTLRFHLTPVRMAKTKVQVTAHAAEDVEQGEHSSIAGGSTDLYGHFEGQSDRFSGDWESIYHMTQLNNSWTYTQRILSYTTRILAQLCS